jgi:type VI secretion system secreted protein Hcp
MAVYMKVEGVKGRVTAEGYKDHIEVETCQVGASCPTQARAGNMADRTGGTISYSDVTVSRSQDDATTELFQKMFEKRHLPKIDFKFVKTGEKFQEYMKITIHDALITNYSISGHGGDNHGRPHETISFSFSQIEYLVKPENAQDGQKGQKTAAYCLKTAKKL